jgi:hypothetical protein
MTFSSDTTEGTAVHGEGSEEHSGLLAAYYSP